MYATVLMMKSDFFFFQQRRNFSSFSNFSLIFSLFSLGILLCVLCFIMALIDYLLQKMLLWIKNEIKQTIFFLPQYPTTHTKQDISRWHKQKFRLCWYRVMVKQYKVYHHAKGIIWICVYRSWLAFYGRHSLYSWLHQIESINSVWNFSYCIMSTQLEGSKALELYTLYLLLSLKRNGNCLFLWQKVRLRFDVFWF